MLRVGAAGFAELGVEEQPAGAGDVRQHAVEHAPVGLVLVEPLRDVIAQVTARLRNAHGDDRLDAAAKRIGFKVGIGRLVAQEGYEVARCGEPDTQHLGIFCRIAQLIQRAGFGLGARRHQADGAGIDVSPLGQRNFHACIGLAPAHRQAGLVLVEAGGIVVELEAFNGRGACARYQLFPDGAHDRLAVVERNDGLHRHALVAARCIRIPAAPDHGPALAEKQS